MSHPTGAHRIGLDIGGTKTTCAVLDGANAMVFRERIATPAGDYTAFLKNTAALVARARAAVPEAAAVPVGAGVPGELEPETNTVKNANSTWLIGKPLQADLSDALGAQVRLANDATCFAVSEARDGAGAGAEMVFGVILGTGVGGGIAVRGTPWRGANRLAGEWGHTPMPFRGAAPFQRACYCGKVNCVETALSGPALARSYAEAGGEDVAAAVVAVRAAGGEARAVHVMSQYTAHLSVALAQIINVLDPDVIVLGGGVSNIASLYEAVPRLWAADVFHASATAPRIVTRLVQNRWGDDSGVRGAAWLWREPLTPPGTW